MPLKIQTATSAVCALSIWTIVDGATFVDVLAWNTEGQGEPSSADMSLDDRRAMAGVLLPMAQGEATIEAAPMRWTLMAPPAALGLLVLVMGLWQPPAFAALLHAAARSLGGTP